MLRIIRLCLEVLQLLLLFAGVFGVPIFLTIMSIVNFKRNKPNAGKVTDGLTMLAGTVYMLVLLHVTISKHHYDESAIVQTMDIFPKLHTPFAVEGRLTLVVLCVLALGSYLILRYRKKEIPPLIRALLISGVYIGIFTALLMIVQFSKISDPWLLFFPLFPVVYILCAVRLVRAEAQKQAERIGNENPYENSNPILRFAGKFMCRVSGWYLLPFLLVFPVMAVLILILMLFGQRPDSVIRVFTETADWRMSRHIPPENIYIDNHYLCTVAMGGHERLVRPLRYGIRFGRRIVVNRQLCVANAFEEAIAERFPRFHKGVRGFYDKKGYPLSRLITTAARADITYIIMKPLEWLFLLYLYASDTRPENRIALQYLGEHRRAVDRDAGQCTMNNGQ